MLHWNSKLNSLYDQNPIFVKPSFMAFRAKVDKLTPAGKALLIEIYKYCDNRQNVDFDRNAVGFMLKRHRYQLALWDRRLLERLLGLKLITVRWQAVKPYIDKRGRVVGRGRKMVYSLDIDVFWCMKIGIKKNKQANNKPKYSQ